MLATIVATVAFDLYDQVIALCWFFYWHFCPGAGADGSLAAFQLVVDLKRFAGEFWTTGPNGTGMAQDWAIVVDNLLDLLDPTSAIRGDH